MTRNFTYRTARLTHARSPTPRCHRQNITACDGTNCWKDRAYACQPLYRHRPTLPQTITCPAQAALPASCLSPISNSMAWHALARRGTRAGIRWAWRMKGIQARGLMWAARAEVGRRDGNKWHKQQTSGRRLTVITRGRRAEEGQYLGTYQAARWRRLDAHTLVTRRNKRSTSRRRRNLAIRPQAGDKRRERRA